MNMDEYNARLQGVIDDLQGGAHADVMVRTASDAIVLIRKRIQERGEDSDGKPFTPYSRTPMLANKSGMALDAYSKIAGSKEKRKDLKWVTIKRGDKNIRLFEIEGGYKQFRELHGRQTRFVDFTFKGEMMGNIAIVSNQQQHTSGEAVIRPKSDNEVKKMEGNNTRRDIQILSLNEDEIGMLQRIYDKGILQIFRKNGL
jgi:hypothetical protein